MSGYPSNDWTLAEAKAWVFDHRDGGIECPCCGRYARVYHRKLNSGQARALIQVYRTNLRRPNGDGMGWEHVPSIGNVTRIAGEWARLRFWGLIEELEEQREDGGRAGFWSITEAGVAFLHNRTRLPSHAYIYANRLLKLDDRNLISIMDALAEKFNYRELMEGL